MYTVYGKIKTLKSFSLAQIYLHVEDVDSGIVATRMISNFNAGHCFYDEHERQSNNYDGLVFSCHSVSFIFCRYSPLNSYRFVSIIRLSTYFLYTDFQN